MKTIERMKVRLLLFQAFFMSVLCLLSACTDDNKEDIATVPDEWILGLPESVSFKVNGGEQNLEFTFAEGVDVSQITYIMPEDAESWCNISIGNNNIKIKVTPFGYSRQTNITLIYDKSHTKVLKVMQISDFSDYFTDETCSELKDGITDADIENIPNDIIKQLAIELKNGNYDKEFRVGSYRPYQHPEVMAKLNKTAKYSLRDNPTGIWAQKGDEMYVMVGDVYEGAEISLMFHGLDVSYSNSQTVSIVKGFNKVVAPITGQIYVMNHVQDEFPLNPETDEIKKAIEAKTVNIHFINGRVNGYADITKHTEEKMQELLDKAEYEFFDLVGKYAHVSWKADQFRGNNKRNERTNLTEQIQNFDNLVYWEQEFAGLVKYNRMFNNRMYFCADYSASSPNASDYRTVYSTKPEGDNYYDELFYSPERYKERLWGPAHEVGHVNQVRPGVKWAGMTEVTNNIYCLYIQEKEGVNCSLQYGSKNPKKEDGTYYYTYENLGDKAAEYDKNNNHKIDDNEGPVMYEAAIDFIVKDGRAHCLPNIASIAREMQLVPFWQLKLYLIDVLGQEDFYHDLYEYFRNNPSPSNNGENAGMDQLDFVRQVCRISNLDLTDFFDKWGFLKVVNTTLNDYGSKSFVITQKDVDALKEEIKNANYPKPKHDNIHLITNNTIDEYRN